MDLFSAVIQESIKTIDNAFERICHCVDQLDENQFWHRENEHVNSIGIIIQHLCGNLNQWVISGIGNQPDIRNRPLEFKDNNRMSKNEQMASFFKLIQECKTTIQSIKSEEILSHRRIQGFENTVLSAMFDTIPHIELHGGQIVYITRLLLADNYKLRWKPSCKEEGA